MDDKALPRGYFGIGVEGISKPMNLGAVLRTAHAFNASFAFAINAAFDVRAVLASDTSVALNNMPVQLYDDVAAFTLPLGCRLIGIEITEDAIDLPSFTHPLAAAYVLGAERIRSRRRCRTAAISSSGSPPASASTCRSPAPS